MKYVQSAFTLIELIIVAAITMVVIGGGIAGFVNFNTRQVSLNTALELNQMFRTAQSKARVRDVPVGCTGLQRYYVRLMLSGANYTRYRLGAYCSVGAGIAISTVSIPPGLKITKTGGGEYTYFHTLESGTNIPNVMTVTVSYTDDTHPFSFTVSKNGAISNVNPVP